ncbi:hypothetical protein ABZZ17_33355 [Streptomyces sp. NPDC006512]|uniref:hypothetical protein n=1 Tax=Streptomyces sp. NPDC006512 TaxID=3154307 RepID=UPI00339F10AC
MTGSSTARLTALGAAPIAALLALAPAAAAAGPAAPAAPAICHLLSQPADPYHLGCREGFRLGVAAGYANGKQCQKLPPPLSPVNPNAFEQGKRQGYVDGYEQAYKHTYDRNCDLPQLPPAQKQPPPQTQTPQSMAAAGQAAGTTWGKEDARLTCTREHANLVPPTTPNVLITAYQNGYRVGYDVAYDEAYRQMCPKK